MVNWSIKQALRTETMFHGRRASACKYSCEPSHPTCDADSSGSDALESSLLECRIYAKHKVGRDDFIGGTKDAIESLLTEGAAGGLFVLVACWTPFANKNILSVITRELCKYAAHGSPYNTGNIIEFSVAAVSKHSMKEAVAREAADTPGIVINDIDTVSDVWDSLLQKVQLFSELVDAITKARLSSDAVRGHWPRRNLFARFTHTLIWRGISSLPHTRHVFVHCIHFHLNLL